MNTDHLKTSLLGIGGIAAGLILATTVVACSNTDNNTDANEDPTHTTNENNPTNDNTTTSNEPPTTVVIYVNDTDQGGGKLATPSTDDSSDPGTEGTDDSSTDGTDSSDPGTEGTDDSSTDDDIVTEAGDGEDDDDSWITPPWWKDLELLHPDKHYDICDKFPEICDNLVLEELPELCDPDNGTCPGWVIDEILDELINQMPPGCTFDDECGPSLLNDIIQELDTTHHITTINPTKVQPLMPGKWMTPGN